MRNNFDFQDTLDNLNRRFEDLVKNNLDESLLKLKKHGQVFQKEKSYEIMLHELEEYETLS